MRRSRRPAARPAGLMPVPRLLRWQCCLPLYVFCGQAMLRVAAPHRTARPRFVSAVVVCGSAAQVGSGLANALAGVSISVRGDSRLLPPAAAAVVRAPPGGLPPGGGAQSPAGGPLPWSTWSWPSDHGRRRRAAPRIGAFCYAADAADHPHRMVTARVRPSGDEPALCGHQRRRQAGRAVRDCAAARRSQTASRKPSSICSAPRQLQFLANQFRVLLAALAYTLMQRLRALALHQHDFARACAATIRTKNCSRRRGGAARRPARATDVASHHPLELYALAAARRRSQPVARSKCCPGTLDKRREWGIVI